MPEHYDKSNFKMNPAAVTYGDIKLGGTDGPVSISQEISYYEVKCNQAGDQVLGKVITGVKVTVKATFKEITKALGAVIGSAKKVNSSLVGADIFEDAKVLQLAEIGGTDTYRFPAAVALKDMSYDMNGVEQTGIEISFECIADSTGLIWEVTQSSAGA